MRSRASSNTIWFGERSIYVENNPHANTSCQPHIRTHSGSNGHAAASAAESYTAGPTTLESVKVRRTRALHKLRSDGANRCKLTLNKQFTATMVKLRLTSVLMAVSGPPIYTKKRTEFDLLDHPRKNERASPTILLYDPNPVSIVIV